MAKPSTRRAPMYSFLLALLLRLGEATSIAHGERAPVLAAARTPGISQLGARACSGALAALLILVSCERQLHGVAIVAVETHRLFGICCCTPIILAPCPHRLVGAAMPTGARVGMAACERYVRRAFQPLPRVWVSDWGLVAVSLESSCQCQELRCGAKC